MRTPKQIVLEEIEQSIATSRFWGKDEIYTYLIELRQRIEYRLRKQEEKEESK
jgi:hypothetical protein